MVGDGTDTAPAHVACALIGLANKPCELTDETDSPRWRHAGSQASSRGFSPGRKAPWRQCMGRMVEGRGRVSCAERAGAAFQVDQTAGAVALRPWGTWQGSPSPVQCMVWKDPLAFDWGPLGGTESQQPHGMVAGSDTDSPVPAPQREWSVSWNLQSWGPLGRSSAPSPSSRRWRQ